VRWCRRNESLSVLKCNEANFSAAKLAPSPFGFFCGSALMSMIPADYVLLGSEEILTIGLASCLYGNQINPNAPKLTLT